MMKSGEMYELRGCLRALRVTSFQMLMKRRSSCFPKEER
jgi:hypothetical protein